MDEWNTKKVQFYYCASCPSWNLNAASEQKSWNLKDQTCLECIFNVFFLVFLLSCDEIGNIITPKIHNLSFKSFVCLIKCRYGAKDNS